MEPWQLRPLTGTTKALRWSPNLFREHASAAPFLEAIKIHSGASRDRCLNALLQLDVRTAEASFPADKARGRFRA